jgi:hypothetical protein
MTSWSHHALGTNLRSGAIALFSFDDYDIR